MSVRLLICVAALLLFANIFGCARYPGNIAHQQRQAMLFDPYPDNDLAPAFEGGRPRSFQVPRSEVVRSRPWYAQ